MPPLVVQRTLLKNTMQITIEKVMQMNLRLMANRSH